MARFRRSFRSRRSSSPKRSRQWAGWETFIIGTQNRRSFTLPIGGSSTQWILPPDSVISEYNEPTVVRLLIRQWHIPVPPDFSAGAYELSFISGIIAVRGEIGATPFSYNGIPNVAVERGDQDYLWYHSSHMTRFQAAAGQPWLGSGSELNDGHFGPYQGYIDVRAKRKLPQGHGLLYFNFLTADSFGGTVVGYTGGRMLLLDN